MPGSFFWRATLEFFFCVFVATPYMHINAKTIK